MLILRKILFYFFAGLYLVLCPLIIFYALGYMVTPKVEEGLVKTGLIHLETLPEGASISIANKQIQEKTPATIRNLLPGKYEISITREGYLPWSQRIFVEPGRAVAFDKILLIPKELKKKILLSESFQDLIPILGTSYLLLVPSRKIGDWKVFDWGTETARPLFAEDFSFRHAELVKVFVSRKSPFVLLEARENFRLKFFGCLLDKEKPEIMDLSAIFPSEEPSEIRWARSRPDYVFVRYGVSLARLDFNKKVFERDWLKGVQGFGLFKDWVYALQSFNLIRSHESAPAGQARLVDRGAFLERLFHDKGSLRIDFLLRDRVLFFGEKGSLVMNTLPYDFVDEGLLGYEESDDRRKVVLWKKDQLGMLDFEAVAKRKGIFERGWEISWIARSAKNVEQVYFVYQGSHALFRDQDAVMLMPFNEKGTPSQKLVSVFGGSSIFYSDRTGFLYYLEPSQGHLMAADIIPGGLNFSRIMTELEKETQEAIR